MGDVHATQMTPVDDLQSDSEFVDALSRLGSRTSSGVSAFSELPAAFGNNPRHDASKSTLHHICLAVMASCMCRYG